MGFCDGRRRRRGVRKEREGERRGGRGEGGERENPGTPEPRTARVKRGKNRDAPDWHEGLRLLAALRQLGGVRRGIEIANAHYGYFPIEGRIPLPVSYRASRSFSFRRPLSRNISS